MITFTPHDDFALVQAKRDVKAWREARGQGKAPPWVEWADVEFDGMKRSRTATSLYLNGSDARLRLAAISLVAEHWLAVRQFARDVLRLAFHDAEPAIRGAALTALQLHAQFIADPTRTLRKLLAELFLPRPPHEARARQFLELAERLLRKAAGEDRFASIQPMFQSRSAAESYLDHANPEIRRAALFILELHCRSDEFGKADEALAKMCEKLAFEDDDAEVRSLALSCLARCCPPGDRARVGERIAWIVFDAREPVEVRISAYRSLFEIHCGQAIGRSPPLLSDSFRFPEDVHWPFVKSFFSMNPNNKLYF